MFYPHGVYTPDALPQSGYTQDFYFDDMSNQMAVSQAPRRSSKGSLGPSRPSSGAMRVVKPRSANNSPRASALASKRRTMMGDAWTLRRPQQVMDYMSMPPYVDTAQPKAASSRPMSWHPSSYLQPPPQAFHPQQPATAFPTPSPYQESSDYYGAQPQFSPAYSNDTSPSSTFSPLPLFSGGDNTFYAPSEVWDANQKAGTLYPPLPGRSDLLDLNHNYLGKVQRMAPPTSRGLDWSTFISQGYSNTSPPTPDTFSQVQQGQPTVSEAAVPYQALDKPDEDEGEILVGMGLYDTPEKLDEDPQLDNYRSTVSSLLGSSFHAPKPEGRGLKLEETWEPPKSDDEDEDEDEDGEEEDDSE